MSFDEQPLGLRERRRLQTQTEIHEAAISLFEEKGVAATTVQDIADRAGISARTFFRYFSSKEQAALPGQWRMNDAIKSLKFDGLTNASEIFEAIVYVAERAMISELNVTSGEHLRIAGLLANEAEMRSLAAAQEQSLVVNLRAALVSKLPDYDDVSLLLIAEVSLALWRSSWVRWGELVQVDPKVDPLEIFRECRDKLGIMFEGYRS